MDGIGEVQNGAEQGQPEYHGGDNRDNPQRRPTGGEPPTFREMSLPLGFAPPWVAEIALSSGTLVRLSSLADRQWIGQLLDQLSRR